MIVGRRPSGTFATIRPTANVAASWSGKPGDEPPEGKKRGADRDRHAGDQPRDPADLALDRARFRPHALGQRRDAPELRVHAGGVDERSGLTADAGRPAEDESSRVDEQAAGLIVGIGRPVDGLRFAGEGREVDLDTTAEEARVGRNPITLADDDDVARYERRRVDDADVAVAHDCRLLRKVALQRLDRAARLPFLREGERGIEHDHRDDRRAQHRRPRDESEPCRDPQQQGKRVDQLVDDLARPLATSAAPELVGPVGEESPRGLALGQALRADAEVAQESLDRLAGVARQGGLGFGRHRAPTMVRPCAQLHIGSAPLTGLGLLRTRPGHEHAP